MSDFSKQLGKVIDFIENCGVSASSSDFDKTESRAKAKAALTDLIIKTVADAKPKYQAFTRDMVSRGEVKRMVDQYEADLIKAIEG